MNDKVFERRFSEHPLFWAVSAAIILYVYIYIFMRLRAEWSDGRVPVIWLLLCFAMTGLSYLSRRSGRLRSAPLRRWTDVAGGLWLLFVLFSFFAMILSGALGRLAGAQTPQRAEILFSFAAGAAVVALGVRQANTIRTTHITVKTAKLPEGRERLRVVQLTDLHLGPYTGVKLLAQILRRVREAEPDMVVVTGDVADGPLDGRRRETAMLRRIRPPLGVYAVTGNHDYYDDIGKAVEFMEKSGMRVLRTEADEAGGIVVEGVDDKDHLREDKWGLTRSETLIVNTRSRYRDKFILLLRHRPVIEIGTEGFFDLQLSGHTHGGQIFPLFSSRLLIAGHSRGFKKLKNGSMLYTSNGAGYVGPPVRLLAPPEVVVIDLVRSQ
ncbi:MAG: metallophosphoesterase [Synergistaceae bacterium]|nr:metallophosphoesterase [Synergistaceae bacterium]